MQVQLLSFGPPTMCDVIEQIKGEVETHRNTGEEHSETWPYYVGAEVKATTTVTEDGAPGASIRARFPDPHYLHANRGDIGTVIFIERGRGTYISNGYPTVRFHNTGTATMVRADEIELA